jgi:(E)-4-hydroxy-3-methylbut-2-enyl-diphosphate synthase
VDVVRIAEELEQRLLGVNKELTVAVMGCAVNGPGEAREADIGVACGKHSALLFRKGVVVGKIPERDIVRRLLKEVEEWPSEGHAGARTNNERAV